MKKIKRKWRRLSLFKKSLIIYMSIFLVLSVVFLGNVYGVLKKYDNSPAENFLQNALKDGKIASNSNVKLDKNKYETSKLNSSKALDKYLKKNDIKVKKVLDEKNTYNLVLDKDVIGTVKLDLVSSKRKLAILTVNEWQISSVDIKLDNGLYWYKVNIPSNYEFYINNKKVSADDIKSSGDVAGLDKITKYIEIEKSNYYEMKNFYEVPEIIIKDENGKKVDYKINNNEINLNREFKTFDSIEELNKNLTKEMDVMKLAENWSLFLTDDLHGAWHGLSQLTPYLIEDSDMYNLAYNWAHNVDITFVSAHSLKNPVFTGEKIKDCIMYSKDAFSCDVYLEKNMTVSGKEKKDILHDRMYFIYKEGWKLVDMVSITE